MLHLKYWLRINRIKFKRKLEKIASLLDRANTIATSTTVKQYIYNYVYRSKFASRIRLDRDSHFDFLDWRHTVATTYEWSILLVMSLIIRFYRYTFLKIIRVLIKVVNSNKRIVNLIKAGLSVSFIFYFLNEYFERYIIFYLITENYLKIILGVLFFIFYNSIKEEDIQKKITYFIKEYRGLYIFLSFVLWTALARVMIYNIYEHYLKIYNHNKVIHLIIFFALFLLFTSLFIRGIQKILRIRTQKLQHRYLKSDTERKIAKYRAVPKIKILLSMIAWTIAFYIVVFFMHKYFYTYILDSQSFPPHSTVYNVFMIYFWGILLITFLVPRVFKNFTIITSTAIEKASNLNYLILFTISFYGFVFFIHKFYYSSIFLTTLHLNLLTSIIFMLLIITIFIFIAIPKRFIQFFKTTAFIISSFIYFLSIFYWINFDRSTPKFQYIVELGTEKTLGLDIIFGIDGISLFFVLLTTIISPLLILITWNLNANVKLLSIILLITELLTLLTFMALDLFIFFIAFESILIPLFISILIWGSRRRKIKAAKMLFIYTLISSILFLIALFTFYIELGSTNFFALLLYNQTLSINKQYFLWCLLFIAFAIKVPLYPLHTWLPEAHVEAPTFGSVILASLLLKTGGYGIFRFVLPLFPQANLYFNPLVFMLALLGTVYAALASIRQIDLKRIIAYLSVSHMNLCVLGQFSETLEGLIGSLLLMAAHGLIAAGFFTSVGFLYERYHNRLIYYYGGLTRYMPIFAINLFIFVLANMNMPGTSNFVGELLILVGIGYKSFILCLIAAIGSAIGALCTIWFWNRLMFGEIKFNYLGKFEDINRRETLILLPLTIFNFAIGIFTNEFIDTCYCSIYYLYSFLIF